MSDNNILDFSKFKQRREDAKKVVLDEVEKRKSKSHSEDHNLLKAVTALVDLMSEQDRLIQMMIEDIVSLSTVSEQQASFNANIASSIAALVTTLQEKHVVSDDEIQKVWERDALPTLQKLEAMPKPENKNLIIQPPPGFTIP